MDKILVQTSKRSVTETDVMEAVRNNVKACDYILKLREERETDQIHALIATESEEKLPLQTSEQEIREMLYDTGFKDENMSLKTMMMGAYLPRLECILEQNQNKSNRTMTFYWGPKTGNTILEFDLVQRCLISAFSKEKFLAFLREIPAYLKQWNAEFDVIQKLFDKYEQMCKTEEENIRIMVDNAFRGKEYDSMLLVGRVHSAIVVNMKRQRKMVIYFNNEDINSVVEKLCPAIDGMRLVSDDIKLGFKVSLAADKVKIYEIETCPVPHYSYEMPYIEKFEKRKALAEASIQALVDNELQGKDYDYALIKDQTRSILTVHMLHQRKLELSITNKNFENSIDGLCETIDKIKGVSDSVDLDFKIVNINEEIKL